MNRRGFISLAGKSAALGAVAILVPNALTGETKYSEATMRYIITDKLRMRKDEIGLYKLIDSHAHDKLLRVGGFGKIRIEEERIPESRLTHRIYTMDVANA